jgi:hypothetical protein
MNLEQKLHEELMRHRAINNYTKKMIFEQEVPPPPPADAPLGGDVPPPPPATDAVGLDAGTPPPPAPMGETMPDDTEEIDITDLVNMTKSIKKDVDDNKQDFGGVTAKMDDVFTKLSDLEQKLAEMDNIMVKIDELGSKVEQMKPQTPQEKLELRSLDSYPFNQKPQEFFAQKQGEMEMTGKNEYVLTKDDIENYSKTITQSFNPELEKDEFKF